MTARRLKERAKRKTKTEKLLSGVDDVIAHIRGEAPGLRVTTIIPPEIDVKRLRAELDLSQREFAERYGFPVATVRNWEQGRRRPEGAARLLLKLIASRPDWVNRMLRQEQTVRSR